MDVISQRSASSTLNPNAPMFVPMAYRTVEDFSDQWWDLVRSSPWFRDYWLQECFHDPQNDLLFPDIYDPALPDDLFADQEVFEEDHRRGEEVEERALVRIRMLKGRRGRSWVEAQKPRYFEKAPKIVNLKVSPRTIQQPK